MHPDAQAVSSPAPRHDVRVLVVSPIDGGSYPISRHAAEAFEELGVETRFVDLSWLSGPGDASRTSAAIRRGAVVHAGEIILDEACRFAPDICFMLAQSPVSPRLLDELRTRDITTAYWFVENYRVTRYWQAIAPSLDWFFSVQDGDFHTELRNIGCRRLGWLPLACNPEQHRPRRGGDDLADYESDLSFAGYGYYNRQRFFSGLKDYDFRIWGPGFETSAVADLVQNEHRNFDSEEWMQIAAGGRIHVNLHSATHVAGVDPAGDYLNPRTFELASCRAFQLVDYRTDLERQFPDGEIPSFSDIHELRQAVDHFLHHEQAREAFVDKAWQRVQKEHTYRHRMDLVLSKILGDRPGAVSKSAETMARESARATRLRELACNPEMGNEEIRLRLLTGTSVRETLSDTRDTP